MSKREALILKHQPLVTFVINRLSTDRVNTLGLEREDAIGFGTEGLIQAIDGFDETRGTSFASYAIRRIRGSVLDAVRRQDPLPRSLRKSTRQVDQAAQDLATQIGRWPSDKEIGMKLGVTARDVLEIRRHAKSRFVSLENLLQDSDDSNGSRYEPPDHDDRTDPATAAERHAALAQLQTAITTLSERDQAILRLRYSQSKPFHEVGSLLGLSESRVCQLHKRILSVLRRQLSEALEDAA